MNLPHFVRVRSIMFPIIGSFSASKTRAATMMPVIAASCDAVSSRVNRINVRRKLEMRTYTMSLPTVPTGKHQRFFLRAEFSFICMLLPCIRFAVFTYMISISRVSGLYNPFRHFLPKC